MSKFSEGMTPREQQVCELAAAGKSNKEIANQLCITTRTVRFHLSNIFLKASVANRLELVLMAAGRPKKSSGAA